MIANDILLDAFTRVHESLHRTLHNTAGGQAFTFDLGAQSSPDFLLTSLQCAIAKILTCRALRSVG
jgi:hypothetical protein